MTGLPYYALTSESVRRELEAKRAVKPQPVPELADVERFGAFDDVWGDAR